MSSIHPWAIEPGARAAALVPPTAPRRVVFSPRGEGALGHDQLTKRAVARHLAELLEWDFVEGHTVAQPGEGPSGDVEPPLGLLWVPADTVVGADAARRMGIAGAGDLFGGVVSHAFVGTKVITHPLVAPDAAAPLGWSHAFPHAVREVVLPGYTAFTAHHALQAGQRLLVDGAVRVKWPTAVGGLGQQVVRDAAALRALVDSLEPADVQAHGLVLERNLHEVVTYSVGQVQLGPWLASYSGVQHTTRNHAGAEVYGGSRLTVVRGDYEAVLAQPLEPARRLAVEQALVYHREALRCFPGLLTTRANYDVAQGVDDTGRRWSGVLEQSWRIGGASGAEAMALQALRADPALQVVEAQTRETFGPPGPLPAGARVYYDGIDPVAGRLVKAAWAQPYGHA